MAGGSVRQPYAGVDFIPQSGIYEFGYGISKGGRSNPAFAERDRKHTMIDLGEISTNWFKNQLCPFIRLSRLRAWADPIWDGTPWTGYFKCREVKTGFCRNGSMQTGSSGTLIGWISGQTTFVPLWDRMEGAWLRTLAGWSFSNSIVRLHF